MPGETVGGEEPRPGPSPSQAAGLLDAQITAGAELHRSVASAADAGELQVVGARVAAWLRRNEAVLVRIFGPSERQSYRLAAPAVVRTRDFEVRRDQLERRISARMRYLRAARAKIELGSSVTEQAGPAESSRKPAWQRILTSQWTINIFAPLIGVAILAGGGYAIAQIFHRGVQITGTVVCESRRDVVGVWIAAATGQADSGYAHLGSVSWSAGAPIGFEGSYSYLLPRGGSYVVHVGCGGSTHHWDSTNYSPELSGRTANLVCRDPTASERGVTLTGSCRAVSAAP
jgi:hypothetical protein